MIENIEKNVVKKTNKYVYLNDGTHMSHSDFHRYKQNIRNEYGIMHAKEFKDSIEVIVVSAKEKELLEETLAELEEQKFYLQHAIDSHTHDWKKSFELENEQHDLTKHALVKHARTLYKDLAKLPIINNYQNTKGIKFIIQKNYKTDEHRFGFDPYELGPNYHSNLSDYYREESWGTINGGWLKVIDNTVTLYAESGDYGVYNSTIAINAAKLIFPDKEIVSYPGQSWGEWDKLPF